MNKKSEIITLECIFSSVEEEKASLAAY